MEGQQASLSRFPSITRKLFLAGYILRIIPVVNIVGTVVTAIAWYKASEWRKHTNYIIAMIGSLTVLVSLLLGIYYGLNTALAYQGMQITSDMTLEQLKSELLKSIDAMQASLTSINALVVPVIAGIGLLLEAPGFYRISRDTENNIPSYITYLAVFIAVIYIVSGPISYVSASRLESLREFIVSAKTKEDLQQQTESLLQSLKQSGLSYASPILEGQDIHNALELRKAGLGLLGNMVGDRKAVACIEDTAVTLEDLPNYISDFSKLMEKFNQNAVYYAHAGAGELHLRPILNLKETEGVKYFREITTEVAKLVKSYKGSFSGEHGDGIVRGEFLPMLIGEKNYTTLKEIKRAFDPQNIFNPGKIVNAYKMDEDLRYKTNIENPKIKTILNFDDSEGILRLAEKCNGSGDCRKTENASGAMCPSYQATKDEKHTTRGRANTLREVLTNNKAINKFDSINLKQVFDLCLSCKACGTECPSNVDIATAKAEFLFQYYKDNKRNFADILFGKSSRYNKMAARFPKLSNAIFNNKFTASIIKKQSGIAIERSFPTIYSKPFNKDTQLTLLEGNTFIKEVILFVDEFSNYLDAPIAKDALYLLQKLNYKVIIIDHLDSARALFSKGFLEEAKKQVNTNVTYLKKMVSESKPLLGIEPSAILGFRDEYSRIADDKNSADDLAKNSFLIEEFLASEIELGNIKPAQFTSEEKTIKIHNHCHQKALSNQKVTFDILNLPINYKPTIIISGCCGMAGSFGFEKDKYKISMKIGELKLFPAVRNTSEEALISANGTSCRHQIKDGTQRKALHPISILKQALLS